MPRLAVSSAALCLLVAACAAPPAPGEPPLPAGGLHRLQARGPAAQALLASGARLVADYGAFQVLDASPSALRAPGAAGAVEVRDDFLRIALNSGELDTSVRRTQVARAAPAVGPEGKALHLFQLAGPIRPEWLARLAGTGVRVVTYVPANAYLVWGDAPALDRLRALAASDEVQYEDAYLPAQKLDRALPPSGPASLAVQLVEDPAANGATLALAEGLARAPGRVSRALGYVNLVVHADRAAAEALAARPDVVSVQPWAEPRLLDERQDVIVTGQLAGGLPGGPGYLSWLAAKGFTQAQFDASAFGVDVSDSGIDNGTPLPNHFGLYRSGDVTGASRVAYARLVGTPHAGSTLQGCDGHGTLNAHVVAGYSAQAGATFADAQGYAYGLGVAPFVRVGSSVVFDPSTFTAPSYEELLSRAWADGMRISSNSWGAMSFSYTADCQRYDALVRDAAPASSPYPLAGNQEMTVVFAAGNAGPGAETIGSPGSAKNVISAGASENVRAFGGADGCGVPDAGADHALDVASFSSRGPAADGRIRPDLVAPGTHVTGGVAQAPGQRAEPPASPAGQANACFVADGVCGGVSSPYFPAGQQWYTASSGTSHSTPAIAGAAALVRQWFLNQGLAAPSPAMTKAFLMNAARYMSGVGANDTLYSNAQGMGLLDLGAAFDGTPRILRDELAEDLLTASGQVRTFTGNVGDPARPFRVTLAWTDAPGSTLGAAWSNDLDLAVAVGGQTYRGNVFTGATSAPGGSADFRNNVESVFLPAGAVGPFTVTVTAANVVADGVPGNGLPLDQDFALVVTNTCGDPPPPAPLGVSATVTATNEITVAWSPNGADSYQVYRGTAPGGPYAPVATVAAPPWVDGTVSGGTTYAYVVRAQLGCATSAASAEASATATGACLLAPVFAGAAAASTTGDVVCGNLVSWAPATPSCGGAISYDLFRSTDAGFVPGPANRIATGLAATSFVDSGDLAAGTAYRYVVRAVETTGAGAVADANAVERASTPEVLVFRDDLDGDRPPDAAAWWLEQLVSGGDPLQLVSGCRWQSPTTAYRFGQGTAACGGTYANSVQSSLVLGGDGTVGPNGLAVPGVGGATLRFRLWYDLETYYDSLTLAYSTAGAAGPFTQVPDSPSATAPYILQGGYDRVTLGGARGWTGARTAANGALPPVLVNLDALAGQTAWFAWRFSTDGSVSREGAYLDDVAVAAACATSAVPEAVGFRVSGLPPRLAADAPATLTIVAVDAWGRTADGYGGTAALSSTDPAAVAPATVTFAAGIASATVRLRTAGAQVVALSDGALRGSASTTVLGGAAAGLRFLAQPGAWTAGTPPQPLAIAVVDAFGNVAASTAATVTLSLGANPRGDALQGTTGVAATNGIATFGSVYLRYAGSGYTLLAAGAGLAGAESAPFAVVAGPPAALAFVQGPADAVAGDRMTPAPSVEVRDGYGNPVDASGDLVTVSLAYGPPGATLSGTLARAAVGSVAVFDDLSVDKAGAGAYALLASRGDLRTSSAPFGAVAAAPYRARFVSAPAGGRAGLPLSPAPSAQLLDRFGNPVLATTTTRLSLSLASNPSLAALVGETTALPAGGLATFPAVAIDRTGTPFALYVGGAGLVGDTSAGFAVTAGPVAAYEVTGPATAPVGVEVAYGAVARDALGNEVTDYLGIAAVTSSDPAASLPAPVSLPAARGGGVRVTFRTAGAQTLVLTERGGAVTGTLAVAVVDAAQAGGGGGGAGDGGGCHCGSAGAEGGALLLAVAALLRPRRRRAA